MNHIFFTHQNHKVALIALGKGKKVYGIFVPTILYYLVQPFPNSPEKSSSIQVTRLAPRRADDNLGFPASGHQGP